MALVPGVLSIAWGQAKPAPAGSTGKTGAAKPAPTSAPGKSANATGAPAPTKPTPAGQPLPTSVQPMAGMQGKPGATGKSGAMGKSGGTGTAQPSAAEVLKKAQQMSSEAGRRQAAAEEQKQAAAKGESGKTGSKGPEAPKGPAGVAPTKTSGFIVEKGDPFAVPLKPQTAAVTPQDLPQGQAGLLVSQVDLQGVIKIASGNRAVVKGPNGRTYFLRVNDKIYNARVTKITEDSIYFEETNVDPLGKATKREVVKTMPAAEKKQP